MNIQEIGNFICEQVFCRLGFHGQRLALDERTNEDFIYCPYCLKDL